MHVQRDDSSEELYELKKISPTGLVYKRGETQTISGEARNREDASGVYGIIPSHLARVLNLVRYQSASKRKQKTLDTLRGENEDASWVHEDVKGRSADQANLTRYQAGAEGKLRMPERFMTLIEDAAEDWDDVGRSLMHREEPQRAQVRKNRESDDDMGFDTSICRHWETDRRNPGRRSKA
jgi:hypothetical protein